jgi:hypothetical protein
MLLLRYPDCQVIAANIFATVDGGLIMLLVFFAAGASDSVITSCVNALMWMAILAAFDDN